MSCKHDTEAVRRNLIPTAKPSRSPSGLVHKNLDRIERNTIMHHLLVYFRQIKKQRYSLVLNIEIRGNRLIICKCLQIGSHLS